MQRTSTRNAQDHSSSSIGVTSSLSPHLDDDTTREDRGGGRGGGVVVEVGCGGGVGDCGGGEEVKAVTVFFCLEGGEKGEAGRVRERHDRASRDRCQSAHARADVDTDTDRRSSAGNRCSFARCWFSEMCVVRVCMC